MISFKDGKSLPKGKVLVFFIRKITSLPSPLECPAIDNTLLSNPVKSAIITLAFSICL